MRRLVKSEAFKASKLTEIFLLFIPSALYIIALSPGRIYRDSAFLLEQMRVGESSDQWTALYFRYLQITTLNGKYLYLNAILGIGTLVFAFRWFMASLPVALGTAKLVVFVMVASPFIGVFGMTVGHDTTKASGVLFLIGILLRLKKSGDRKINKIILFFGVVLSSTSFLGFTALIGFAFGLALVKKKKLSFLIIFLVLFQIAFGSIVLNVNRASDNLTMTSFLGDIKCIAQHPDAKISPQQWDSIKRLASETEWKTPTSCWIADNAYFALDAASKNPKKTAILWVELATQNPQIAIMARIQRASVALPPVFFSPPPNMIENNYGIPIGSGTKDDLQRYSELFKTSIDDLPSKELKHPIQSPFEYLVLFFAFIFNQHSSIWGWAGLWLTIAIILGKKVSQLKMVDFLISMAPLIAMHLAMALISPAPNPRYLMATILVGISFSLVSILGKVQSINK